MTDTSRGILSTHGSSAGQTSPPRPPLGEAKPVRKSLRFIVNSTYVGNQIVWCTLSTVPKRSRLITRGENCVPMALQPAKQVPLGRPWGRRNQSTRKHVHWLRNSAARGVIQEV
jgi:hypothetical protein